MTWEEAQKVFREQVPVVYMNSVVTRDPIVCTRIAEITLRCDVNGKITRIVAGMDKNENCLYKDYPEFFTRRHA